MINKYFKHHYELDNSNEHDLYQSMYDESIQIRGSNVFYIVRTVEHEDFLFGEDVLSSFSEHYEIEMYLEDIEEFGGQGDMLSKFGFTIEDQMTFNVSKTRFIEITGLDMPNEGDLIYLPMSKHLFEIKYVEHERQFYPLMNNMAFQINCELFRYNQQEFETGIEILDEIPSATDLFDDAEKIETEADSIAGDQNNPFLNY